MSLSPRDAITFSVTVPAIATNSLEKWFPPAQGGWRAFLQPFASPTWPALREFTFEVRLGEAVALLGTNGAGKSTLLRVLATLLAPTKGSAMIAGHDAAKEPRAVRRQLGYHAGSDLGFYARLTGRENLSFFGQLNHVEDVLLVARIEELAARLHLEDALERQVRTLSSGTIQRLSLARALLHRPKVLLLDEPTRSLDAIAAAEFRHFLKNEILRAGSTSLLFASHTLPEIEFLADRVAVLKEGRLIAFDSCAALIRSQKAATLEEAFQGLTGATMPAPAEVPLP